MPFPPEILDIIFSFLCDDKQSLKACSLVARVWLQPVRAHFFHVVLTPVNVDEFIELAANAGSFIASTLQDIALTRNWDAIQISAFPSLQNVTCMVIHNMEYAPTPLHTVLLGMPSVTHLYLDQVSFESFSETTLALCLFPALQSVSLCDVSWLVSAASPHLLPATVTHLSLTLCYQRDVFNWLLNQKPIPHLNLGTSVAPSDAPSIGEYLAHCGPALRSLRLGFSSFDAGGDAEDFLASVNLTLNPGLVDLCFDEFIGERELTQVTTAGSWILKILAQVSALRVISFGVEGDIDLAEIDWDVLDGHLIRLQVDEARFFTRNSPDICKRLPVSYRKGILTVMDS